MVHIHWFCAGEIPSTIAQSVGPVVDHSQKSGSHRAHGLEADNEATRFLVTRANCKKLYCAPCAGPSNIIVFSTVAALSLFL